jgi:hypothetical protein
MQNVESNNSPVVVINNNFDDLPDLVDNVDDTNNVNNLPDFREDDLTYLGIPPNKNSESDTNKNNNLIDLEDKKEPIKKKKKIIKKVVRNTKSKLQMAISEYVFDKNDWLFYAKWGLLNENNVHELFKLHNWFIKTNTNKVFHPAVISLGELLINYDVDASDIENYKILLALYKDYFYILNQHFINLANKN